MLHKLNDLEGLHIAAEMEKRGEEYYRRGARVSDNPHATSLLLRLADDEHRHHTDFCAQYERLRDLEAPDLSAPYDLETSAYLSAIAADVVYPGGLIEMARDDGLNSPAAILRGAVQAEKDSILFYTELNPHLSDARARRVFDDIAEQERAHLKQLQAMLLEVEGL